MPPPPPLLAAPRRKKRGALRFVASSCVFSAWLTLIFSLLFAGGSFLAGAAAMAAFKSPAASSPISIPALPTPSATGANSGLEGDELNALPTSPFGGSALGGALPGGMGSPIDAIKGMIPTLSFVSGAFTLVTGVVGFILFLGLAQACYALLDLEDQSFQMAQTLQMIVARLGAGR